MKLERVNDKMDIAVNLGLAATLMSGVVEGIKVMRDNKVPMHIAARVIQSPELRRATDWKH